MKALRWRDYGKLNSSQRTKISSASEQARQFICEKLLEELHELKGIQKVREKKTL